MKRYLILSLTLTLLAACGSRGEVQSACLSSGRSGATPLVCSCVQRVAESTLTASERRKATPFFADPDKAQEARARDDAASEAFWRRYRAFATAAEARCG